MRQQEHPIYSTLTNSYTITDPPFHPCVRFVLTSPPKLNTNFPHRLNHLAPSKALSFVPPDGHLKLMEYRFDPSESKPGAAPPLTAAAQVQVQVPFTRRTSHLIPDHGGAQAELTHRVQLYLGSSTMGATSTGSTGSSERMYVPARRTLRWSLASSASTTSGDFHSVSATGCTATLRGTFASSDAHLRPARVAQISFALPEGMLLSALKIDQLKLSAETYNPYKGIPVRGWALEPVEWSRRRPGKEEGLQWKREGEGPAINKTWFVYTY
jgi:AP-3 complex subunit mu